MKEAAKHFVRYYLWLLIPATLLAWGWYLDAASTKARLESAERKLTATLAKLDATVLALDESNRTNARLHAASKEDRARLLEQNLRSVEDRKTLHGHIEANKAVIRAIRADVQALKEKLGQ